MRTVLENLRKRDGLGSVTLGILCALSALVAKWDTERGRPDTARLIAIGLVAVPGLLAVGRRSLETRNFAVLCAGVAVPVALLGGAVGGVGSVVSFSDEPFIGPVLLLVGAVLVVASGLFSGSDEAFRRRRIAGALVSILITAVVGAIVWRGLPEPDADKSLTAPPLRSLTVQRLVVPETMEGVVKEGWIAPVNNVNVVGVGDGVVYLYENVDGSYDGIGRLAARDVSGSQRWERDEVREVQVSRSGDILLERSGTNTIELLDSRTGETQRTYSSESRFAVDDNLLARRSEPDTLTLSDLETGEDVISTLDDCYPESMFEGPSAALITCGGEEAILVSLTSGSVKRYSWKQYPTFVSRVGRSHVRISNENGSRLLNLEDGKELPTSFDYFAEDLRDPNRVWGLKGSQERRFVGTPLDSTTLQPIGPEVQFDFDLRDADSAAMHVFGDELVVVPDNGVGTSLSPAGQRRRGIVVYRLSTGKRVGEFVSSTMVVRPDFIFIRSTKPAASSSGMIAVDMEGVVDNGYSHYVGVFQLSMT